MPEDPDPRIKWLMSDFGGDLEVLPPAPPWFADAACRDHDPALWFPEERRPATAAKAVCAACPVRDPCLSWALDEVDVAADESPTTSCRFGVFAGLSPRERTAVARQRARTAAA